MKEVLMVESHFWFWQLI